MNSRIQFLKRILSGRDFELKLANDVYWVPYTLFSEELCSFEKIMAISKMSPCEKRKYINTIDAAVMLFVVSDFGNKDDTIKIEKDNIIWEYYKNGEQAVETNFGCCASCCSWANYLLETNFEEVGIIGIVRPVGGHAINYFYKDSWYYIMDFQTLVAKYRETICPQTGVRADFVKSRFITGVLVKARSLEAYVRFYSRYTHLLIPEHLFLRERMLNGCPIGTDKIKTGIRHVYIPKEMCVDIIEQKKKLQTISYEMV